MDPSPIPTWLHSPPVQRAPTPPTLTAPALLPLHDLHWEDFERLCLRLARLDGEPEYCSLFGTRGQAQSGIDIYARGGDGKNTVYQCKRLDAVDPGDIKGAVDKFLNGQ